MAKSKSYLSMVLRESLIFSMTKPDFSFASQRLNNHRTSPPSHLAARGSTPTSFAPVRRFLAVGSKIEMHITIRTYQENDWPVVWPIIENVFRRGETYAFDPGISEEEAHKVWIEAPTATYVAVTTHNEIVGTYYIKPNQPGLGSHVCNCGYVVSEHARGKGVASRMCEHSQQQAVLLGFKAMQYNLVVSTNQGAIRLWKRHGFHVVGTLPGAFNSKSLGYIDALVMYKVLKT
jgi:ribosomal protein S18 acetylase RimI-like enzyme